MLIDSSIADLHGGVSQQPYFSRFPNQLEAQTNCLSDPVRGLRKRPATEWVSKLADSGDGWDNAAVLPIDRDPENRFVALCNGTDIRVIDVRDGQEYPVTGSRAYLASNDPRRDITSLTVADYTFLVNRSVVVQALPNVSPSRPHEALIFVRAGNYARTYEIWIDGARRASYRTPTGSDPDQGPNIDTANIAKTLVTGVTPVNSQFDEVIGSLNSVPGLTVEQIGSLIYISSETEFEIRAEDGQGGEAIRAIKDTVQSFSDLPRGGKEGFRVKIRGSQGSEDDDYYVVYEGNETWRETVADGVKIRLDPATMPHALIRQPDGSFTLEALPWVDRECGDDNTNPFPSIVGFPLSSLVYFRNRLGFLADENVVLSQAGDLFNLFRTTVTRLIDSDPIDLVAADSSGESSPVSKLRHGVAFDRKLVLFSDRTQFILDSPGDVLSPGTAQIDPVTAFAASAICRPVPAGRMVYFPFDRGGASGVREFYVDGVARTEDAPEVTAHVPDYLPPNIFRMTGTTLENTILALSSDTPNKLFVYRYFWNGEEKLQSAWSDWEFSTGDRILGADFFDNEAILTVSRADGVHMERMRFRPRLTDANLPYFTLLDSRVHGDQITLQYDAVTDRTRITLPYAASGDMQVYTLRSPTNIHAPGLRLAHEQLSASVLTVPGDKTAWTLCVGRAYTASFEPTRPVFRRQDGTVNTTAILKIRDYAFDYAEAGYFKVEFLPAFREARPREFAGRILGATALSVPPLSEGTFRLKTPCRNTHWALRFSNDSPFQSAIKAASWRGLLESRSQSV